MGVFINYFMVASMIKGYQQNFVRLVNKTDEYLKADRFETMQITVGNEFFSSRRCCSDAELPLTNSRLEPFYC